MAFLGIGILMFLIIVMVYMRMINRRLSGRRVKYKSDLQYLLEKINVFESYAKDIEALELVESSLKDFPDNPILLAKKKEISERLQPKS